MEWLVGAGLLVAALVFLAVMSFGGDDTVGEDKERDYQWGDELHEYSYRHPWDDEA